MESSVLEVREVGSICVSKGCLSWIVKIMLVNRLDSDCMLQCQRYKHNTFQCCLAVAMASYCASSKENSSAYTFIIFKPCPYNMALFLKMKSINESEIQESTSPCASHVHIQHLETHDIYFSQTSTGCLCVRVCGGRGVPGES